MDTKRPVNLDLFQFKFPPMAILSITHRISGVVLFLWIPFFLYILHCSVDSPLTYIVLQHALQGFWMRLALWIGLSAVFFHLLSGIRHMAMDLGFWEIVTESRWSAYATFVLGLVVILLLVVWIW